MNKTAAIVNVESAFVSKINWAALISLVAAILSIWGIAFPAEAQQSLLALIYAVSNAITVLGPIVIMIFRTWFTKSVTPESISQAPVVSENDGPMAAMTLATLQPPQVVDARGAS